MLDLCEYIILKSDRHDRVAAENVMKFNDWPQSFSCGNLKTSLSTPQYVTSISISPKNLSIAKCEERLYNNLKKGKRSDDTYDWNKTLRFQYCLVLT